MSVVAPYFTAAQARSYSSSVSASETVPPSKMTERPVTTEARRKYFSPSGKVWRSIEPASNPSVASKREAMRA